ncbi:MAG: sulfatase-like hydrolase/transferase, partial [Planctomycetota bacterium]
MKSFPVFLILLLFGVRSVAQDRPNVLFIIVDDLNDMPLDPVGKPDVPTPNFDRLAARGVSFTNAHCNDPICAPSRSSMLTGLYPQTSSLYWFEDYRQNAILSRCVTLTEHLATHGYDVFSVGKIYHGNQDPKGFYAGKGMGGNIGPWPWDGQPSTRRGFIPHPQQLYFFADDADPDMDYKWEHTFGPLTMFPEYAADPANKIPGYRGWTLSGKPWKYISDDDRDPMPDESNAAWAADVLRKKHDKPFALFTGFSRTHTPLYAPQKYFDLFP